MEPQGLWSEIVVALVWDKLKPSQQALTKPQCQISVTFPAWT